MVDFGLGGKVALVTGASRGIGRGLAVALAAAGATVAAAARDEAALDDVVDEIIGVGGRAHPLHMDVREVESIRRAFAAAVADLGRIDVLVNNAGLGDNHPALDVTPEQWDEMMAVNLRGLFFCAQSAGRTMVEQGSGAIVNMSSQASLVGIVDHAAYCATKGGVNALTRVLALEWGPRGVTVNAVAPTFVFTPGTAERLDDPDYRANVERRIPVGRVGTIDDVAAAVIYLASPAGSMVNGSVLVVDGGWTAQ